jgi:hypothetical protein
MAGFTVTERLCDPLTAPAVSVTVTEKLNVVAVVSAGAVPDTTPDEESVSHDGSPLDCHVSGVVPPVSTRVWLYATPDVVAGSDVVITDGGWLIVRVNVLVENAERLSVIRNVKLTAPLAVGVPLSKPAPVIVSHEGNVDPLSVKMRVPVPPVAVIVWLYGRFTVHDGSGEAFVIAGSGFTTMEYVLLAEALSESVAFAEKE